MVLTVIDLERVPPSFDHDSLIELLQEFYLPASLVEGDLHQRLASVHVDQSHRHTVGVDHVEEQHDAMADFELGDFVVFEHVL